jgi:hypothetical protein
MEMAVLRGGIVKGGQAAAVLALWAIAVAKRGHELGEDEGGNLSAAVREYATYWKLSERTAWRELDRFKQVFEEEDSPARLSTIVNATADVRSMSRNEVVAGLRLAV